MKSDDEYLKYMKRMGYFLLNVFRPRVMLKYDGYFFFMFNVNLILEIMIGCDLV